MKNTLTALLAMLAALPPGQSAAAEFHQADATIRIADNELINFDKLLFVKRQTYHSSHFYTDFIDGCSRFGGNLCVLDLASGEVTDLLPGMAEGIFGRFDLHFSAEKIVFD